MDLTEMTKNVRVTLKKNSPAILTGLGVAGFIGTAVSVGKATPKAMMLLEEKKLDLDREKLTPVEVVQTVWFCYVPSVVMGALSILCILSANNVNAKRNAALATAYSLSETALKEYKSKVIETIGEKKEKVVRDSISQDKIEKNPVVTKEVVITEKGNYLCYEPLSGRYFKSDIDQVKKAINEVNRRLLLDSYISLNDLYDELGLEYTQIGDKLGWRIEQSLIDIDFSTQTASDGTPCLVLDFVTAPMYDYNRWY